MRSLVPLLLKESAQMSCLTLSASRFATCVSHLPTMCVTMHYSGWTSAIWTLVKPIQLLARTHCSLVSSTYDTNLAVCPAAGVSYQNQP